MFSNESKPQVSTVKSANELISPMSDRETSAEDSKENEIAKQSHTGIAQPIVDNDSKVNETIFRKNSASTMQNFSTSMYHHEL